MYVTNVSAGGYGDLLGAIHDPIIHHNFKNKLTLMATLVLIPAIASL